MTSPQPLNLLFLHGYTQSASLFRAKSVVLTKHLAKHPPTGYTTVTTFFAQGPHRLLVSDLPFTPPPGMQDGEDEESNYWAWWRRRDATNEYTGMPEMWKYLSTVLRDHGPFHGVVGFSQGAALAAMLAAVLEPGRAESRPKELDVEHPPLKFAVCYSGFRPPAEFNGGSMAGWFDPPIETPVLHFLGTLDAVVTEERTMALVNSCKDPVVVRHPGGHFLVAQKQYLVQVSGFVDKVIRGESTQRESDWEDEDDDRFPF